MTSTFIEKFQKFKSFKSNLHLMRTLRLIWSVTGGGATLTVVMIVIESSLYLASIYILLTACGGVQ